MDGLRPTKPLTGLPPVEALLTPQRWQRIKEIFSLALEHEGGYRAALLEEACAGDEALRAEVDSLLSSAANGGPGTKEVFKSISPEQADFSLPQAEDAMLGRRVGDYRIQRRIGYGGMATVYLAVRADKEYQKEVAVKIVRPDLDNHELFQRFRNERQTLAELDHPNIVKLLDGGTTEEGLPYLVMDYVDGEPITRFCDSHKLSTRQRLTLFCKVCAAVQCAHEHFIVHRDLKPSNILVTVDENPKLLDFGIAKVLNSTFSDETTLTKTLARRLTPAYASPEQVRGQKINIATDIYSLGVVLYELLTGHWPYKLRQHTPAEFERAICEDEPEKPSTAVSRVETETTLDGQTITRTPESVSETREGQPEKLRNRLHGDLDTIVLMALQKEAERRYLSVQKLSEDIQRHLADRPIEARRQGTLYRASKVLRRHKAEVITGAAIFFLMLAASGAFLWQQHRAMEKVRAEVHIQRSTGRRSIAVLGFRNISGRNESSWLSTALAEMLTTELAAGGHLKAVPGENIANVSVPEADSLAKESLAKVYKNLGSDFVVVGSYLELQNPNRGIRLDVRLQDAVLGDTIAAFATNGSEDNLSDLVVQAGANLRERLGIAAIPAAEMTEVKASVPSNLDAVRLFSEGLSKLRRYEVLAARESLEKAIAADPNFSLAHSALADAWATLGYEAKSQNEAQAASELSSKLPREETLQVQARYFQSTKDFDKAIDAYHTLFNFFPDNLEYGLRLAAAQVSAGKPQDSLQTLQLLRKLPFPEGQDPRIDLAEANAVGSSDFNLQAAAAERAASKAEALGERQLAGRARVSEGKALNELGRNDEAIAVILRGKELLSAAGDRYGEALALKYCANVLFAQNKFEYARKAYEQSLQLLQALGNRSAQAGVLNNLANVFNRENNISEAEARYIESLAISRELGKRSSEAVTLTNIAVLETSEGDLRGASTHFQEALAIDRQIGKQSEITSVLDNFALVRMAQGRPAEAEKMLNEAIQLSRHSGQKQDLCEGLENLAGLRFSRDGPVRAKRLYSEALTIAKEAKNDVATSFALSGLATIAAARDDLASARNYNEQSLSLRQKIGDGEYIAESWLDQADLSLDEGVPAQAEILAKRAIAEFHKQRDWEYEAQAQALLVDALIAQSRIGDAQTQMASARACGGKTQDRGILAVINIADARLRAASGETSEAKQLLQSTVDSTRDAGFALAEFRARLALAEIEIQVGNYAGASTQLKNLARDATAKEFLFMAHKAAAARKTYHHS